MNRRSILGGLVASFGLGAGHALAEEAAWPARPIRFVVPFPPGGATDVLARTVSRKLSQSLGQQVIVDNRPGGGGTIGANAVARAPADGYTMLFANTNIAINPSLYKSLPYAPGAFAAVAQMTLVPVLYVVRSGLPAKTLPEFSALARKQPGQMNYGSAGNGSFPHLAVELFKHRAGISLTHIPYSGLAPAMSALLAGDVQFVAVDILTAMPFLKAGSLRALAVSTEQRVPMLPEVPTVAETGLAGFSALGWHGIMVPAGTPEPVIRRLNAEVNSILREQDVRSALTEQGFVPAGGSVQEFAQFVKDDTARWRTAVSAAGVQID